MRHALAAAGLLAAIALLYLLLWPVPIDPVAWHAPEDRGLVDPFAPDERLRAAKGIDLGHHEGPEDATLGVDGHIYATTKDGQVIRVDGKNVEAFAETGGRPLGIITDRDGTLVVANAILGLQRIDSQGHVTTLSTAPANSVAAAQDGRLFFSEPSRKFAATDYAGTYEAS